MHKDVHGGFTYNNGKLDAIKHPMTRELKKSPLDGIVCSH